MKDENIQGLAGLLNGTPVSPKEQWKLAARVNSLREMIIELIAAEMSDDSTEFEQSKLQVRQKQQALEQKFLDKMFEKRAETIKEKAKDARYRKFQ